MKISRWNLRTFKRLCKSTLLKIIRKSISKNPLTKKIGKLLETAGTGKGGMNFLEYNENKLKGHK